MCFNNLWRTTKLCGMEEWDISGFGCTHNTFYRFIAHFGLCFGNFLRIIYLLFIEMIHLIIVVITIYIINISLKLKNGPFIFQSQFNTQNLCLSYLFPTFLSFRYSMHSSVCGSEASWKSCKYFPIINQKSVQFCARCSLLRSYFK